MNLDLLSRTPFEQIIFLVIILFVLITVKAIIKKSVPKESDFFRSLGTCLTIYSTIVIVQLIEQVGETGNDIIIPFFIAFAVHLWMTFKSILQFFIESD